ncbi:MAG: class I SAM-dependent methyltransferase [Planctomycetota bacterium]
MTKRFAFDKQYYDRFYRDPSTRVSNTAQMRRLGKFVSAYLAHLGQPVETVLDLGCGLGAWQPVIRRHFPKASYTGVEISDYLCREYGWEPGSVVDYRPARPADLVVCHGVLQYLSASEARRAVANLARCCGGAMFLEALTAEDWDDNCDRAVTDGDVYLREAAWYRQLLRRHFINCGGGIFMSRATSPAVLYELEKLD